MNDVYADLSKAQARAQPSTKQLDQLDLLVGRLEDLKARLEKGSDNVGPSAYEGLTNALQGTAAKLQDGQKEYHSSLMKLQKALDKRFSTDLKPLLPVAPEESRDPFSAMYFSDPSQQQCIDQSVADYLVREGHSDTAQTLVKEANLDFPEATLQHFEALHTILAAIEQGNLEPALKWASARETFLESKGIPLLFHLHRSCYIRLLTADTIPLPPSLALFEASLPGSGDSLAKQAYRGPGLAMTYARLHFRPFFAHHSVAISRLLAAAMYAPLEKLLASSYSDVLFPEKAPTSNFTPGGPESSLDAVHAPHLVPLFTTAYCAAHDLPREAPLLVATSIGGGGALAKIAKARSVMQSKGTHWSQSQELPIELALREEERFHSVFACPVSKEQSTESNPPMRMACGHVIAKDSLDRLARSSDRIVKCPYCPNQASADSALRVYF